MSQEQPLFCTGDRVVCINSYHKSGFTGLIEGKVYTIRAVKRSCCNVAVDVGLESNYPITECACGKDYQNKGVNWKNQNRFVPIDTNSQLEEAIFESLKGIAELKG